MSPLPLPKKSTVCVFLAQPPDFKLFRFFFYKQTNPGLGCVCRDKSWLLFIAKLCTSTAATRAAAASLHSCWSWHVNTHWLLYLAQPHSAVTIPSIVHEGADGAAFFFSFFFFLFIKGKKKFLFTTDLFLHKHSDLLSAADIKLVQGHCS